MRLLVLAPQPFHIQRGTPVAVKTLLESLGAAGHSCDVVAYPAGRDPGLAGVRIFRVPALPGLRATPPGPSLRKLVADALMFPMAAWRLWRGRYDLVVAVEEAAFMALALRPFFGVPYLYDVDSSLPEQIRDRLGLPDWMHRVLVAGERRAVRGSIGALPCCRALGDMVRGHAPALPVQTLEDVPLLEAGVAAPAARGDAEPVVMYVGNLEAYQGVGLLIAGLAEAAACGVPARLVVIGGSGAAIRSHREQCARLGVEDRVVFRGPCAADEVGRHLEEATIVASPRTQGRNTPMKVYTYLASGRALLATRLETHTQILDDEIAMLVAPTPAAVGAGIAALLGDAAMRERLARRAGERVQREFSAAAYVAKLNRFLDEEIVPRLDAARRRGRP